MEHHPVDLPDATGTSRRRLLSSLLAGGALAASAPLLSGRAAAESASPSTTAPPNRDASDNAALNAGIERESRMAATYAAAVAKVSDADDKAALLLIHDHHVAYAQALKGYLGRVAVAGSQSPLASPAGSFTQIAAQMAGLEDETVSIHTGILAGLKGINAASLIASIITVEARHSAALELVSGATPLAAAGN